MYTVADLCYDAVAHRTTLPDGTDVPHVTHVLAAVGLSTDFEALAAAGPRMGRLLAGARDRGTAVHADCHAFDDDDLVWETVDPRVRPYVEAWAAFRENRRLVPLLHARERQVYHGGLGYTGILDGVFKVDGSKRGTRILVDLKTGHPDDAAAHCQTAAYALAWDEEHPDDPIEARWAVWLTPGLRTPYRIIDYSARPDAAQDIVTFLAALTVYRDQPGRRARIA